MKEAALGQCLYLYGVWDGRLRHGDLYQLSTNNWMWRKVCDGSAGGPGRNTGCRMTSYHDQLLVVGGYYGEKPSSRQAGASYDDNGRTNEVHAYNLSTGKVAPLR